ncbi:MAG: nucleotidyltransferase substrate binding protein [Candidatus Binatia bacterium]
MNENAFELAWKTLKDYLEESGIVVNPVTPRNTIKEAFAAKSLEDAQVWIDMMLHRNLLGLTPHEIDLIRTVFRRFPVVREVALYGSRAKGTYRPESDLDLALISVDDDIQAEAIADELDELPLPYRFDVKAYGGIKYGPLREHIAHVGISLYRRDSSNQIELTDLKELGYEE